MDLTEERSPKSTTWVVISDAFAPSDEALDLASERCDSVAPKMWTDYVLVMIIRLRPQFGGTMNMTIDRGSDVVARRHTGTVLLD